MAEQNEGAESPSEGTLLNGEQGGDRPSTGEQPSTGQEGGEVAQNTGAEGAGASAEGEQPAGEGSEESGTLLSGDEGSGSDGEEEGGSEAKNAPEKYEFKPPEGVQLSADAQSRIDDFAENVARNLDLSQEQFQGLMEKVVEDRNAQRGELADKYMQRVTGWQDAARNDKELGGESLQANVAVAKKALSEFGGPELGKLIDAPSKENPEGLGLGNHPEFLRFAYRVGKAISEGQLITGNEHRNAGASEQERLKRYYPSMFPSDG